MPKSKLSVCVLALNEADKLKSCLESVKKLADEIIVGIDDQTSDDSFKVAKKYTDKVFVLKHVRLFHVNKQKVVDKATQPWILWLDADEKLEPGLVTEIKAKIKTKDSNGYYIPRKNYIFNKWVRYSGWYPDYQLRLWQKGKVIWPCVSIHEDPMAEGATANLKGHLIHLNYTSVDQYLSKLNKYTSLDAERLAREIKPPYLKHVLIRPLDELIKRLVAEKGYKDGLHGLVLSMLQAFYELVVVVKIWEKTKFKPEEAEILTKVEKQGKNLQKAFKWWKRELKIKETGNQVVKVWNKGLRKLGF